MKLIGTMEALRTHQAQQRARVITELGLQGAAVTAAEREAARPRAARAARAGTLGQILGWNDPHYGDEHELGRIAHMTHQRVREFRQQFDEDADMAPDLITPQRRWGRLAGRGRPAIP